MTQDAKQETLDAMDDGVQPSSTSSRLEVSGEVARASRTKRAFLVLGAVAAIPIVLLAASSFWKSTPEPPSKVANIPGQPPEYTPGDKLNEKQREALLESNRRKAEEAKKAGKSHVDMPVEGEETFDIDEYLTKIERLQAELEKSKANEEVLRKEIEALRIQAQQRQKQPDAKPSISYYAPKGSKVVYASPESMEKNRAAYQQEVAKLQAAVYPKPTKVAFQAKEEPVQQGTPAGTQAKVEATSGDAVIIRAGTTVYATLDMTVNSDAPGPVVATLQDGPLAGAKVIGGFTRAQDYLVIQFNQLSEPDGDVQSIQAYAVSPHMRSVALADEVDYHLLSKVLAVFGAAWLQGVGEAMMASKRISTVETGSTERIPVYESTLESGKDVAIAGLGRVGESLAQMLQPYAQRPPTVTKHAHTGVGVLFLTPVVEKEQ